MGFSPVGSRGPGDDAHQDPDTLATTASSF